jgi:phosphoribosylanthranilate isomerase
MKIKVCGFTEPEQISAASELSVDFAGMIFYPQSPRYVLKKMKGEEVKKMNLPLEKAGVFVNASEEDILKYIAEFDLQVVQLHGDETPIFCSRISEYITVIKAFRIMETETNIDWLVKDYMESCDYFMFDKGSAGLYGGSGEKFHWSLLSNATIGKPFFLSGGIAPGDEQALKDFSHPYFYGVDINSRFETSPGVKDMNMVKEFVSHFKK